jgi:nicotinate-nucleotide pyrophosphorylase (carboxylating)
MELSALIREALAEDILAGRDVTTDTFTEFDIQAFSWIEARESAVVSGLTVAADVLRTVDDTLELTPLVEDGASVGPMQRVLEIRGRMVSILKAERTALNFLCHLSGIATRTREFVAIARPYGTQILCTRKTTPGLRDLEVAAVRHGGGDAYRTNLSDAVLLKDNHLGVLGGMEGVRWRLAELERATPGSAAAVLRKGKVEADTPEELAAAVEMGWRQILLDNFSVAEARAAAQAWGKVAYLEVSGGVNAGNIRDYAATGVQAISIGALTHSSKATDFSLETERRPS